LRGQRYNLLVAFGLNTTEMMCPPKVDTLYSMVNGIAEAVIGNCQDSPIYGELSKGGMQKIVDF
jgi:hypothetical protein